MAEDDWEPDEEKIREEMRETAGESPAEVTGEEEVMTDGGTPVGGRIDEDTLRNSLVGVLVAGIALALVFVVINPEFLSIFLLLAVGVEALLGFFYGEKSEAPVWIAGSVIGFILIAILGLVVFALNPLLIFGVVVLMGGLGLLLRGIDTGSGSSSTFGAIMFFAPLAGFLYISGMPVELMVVIYALVAAAIGFTPGNLGKLYDLFNLTTAAVWAMSSANVVLTIMGGDDILTLGFGAMVLTSALTSAFMFTGPPHIEMTFEILDEILTFFGGIAYHSGGLVTAIGSLMWAIGFLLFLLRESVGIPRILEMLPIWMIFTGGVLVLGSSLYRSWFERHTSGGYEYGYYDPSAGRRRRGGGVP